MNKFVNIAIQFITLTSISIFFGYKTQIKISYDGYLYLVSAISLFSEDMGNLYNWIREPGYPLFLRIFLDENYDFSNIIMAQSLLLSFSSFVILYFFQQTTTNKFLKSFYFFASLVALILVIGYSTWLFQQSLFIFIFSLHILFYLIIISKKFNAKIEVIISSGLLLATSILSIILIPASIFFIIYIIIKFNVKEKEDGALNFKKQIILVVLPSLIFLIIWNVYKITEVRNATSVFVSQEEILHKVHIFEYGEAPFAELVYSAPSNLGGILGITNERSGVETLPPLSTHYFFAFSNNGIDMQCSTLLEGPNEILKILGEIEEQKCGQDDLFKYYAGFFEATKNLLPVFLAISFLFLLLTITRFDTVVFPINVYILLSIFPYLLEVYGKSRYGVVFIFYSPFIFTYMTSLITVKPFMGIKW